MVEKHRKTICLKTYDLWQRNYYGHIIHNKEDLNRIHQCIRDNPKNWDNDKIVYRKEVRFKWIQKYNLNQN